MLRNKKKYAFVTIALTLAIGLPASGERKWGSPCADILAKFARGSEGPPPPPRYALIDVTDPKADIDSKTEAILSVTSAQLKMPEVADKIVGSKRRLFLKVDGLNDDPLDFLNKRVERTRILVSSPRDADSILKMYGIQDNDVAGLKDALRQTDVIARKLAQVEGAQMLDASFTNGLKSIDLFKESLKSDGSQELVILVCHNLNGRIIFGDGSSTTVNEAIIEIMTAGHAPLVLTCNSADAITLPGTTVVSNGAFYFEEFAAALTHSQTVLKGKGCHAFYVGDYLFSIDEFFHKRRTIDKTIRFLMKPSGAGTILGTLLVSSSVPLPEDDTEQEKESVNKLLPRQSE